MLRKPLLGKAGKDDEPKKEYNHILVWNHPSLTRENPHKATKSPNHHNLFNMLHDPLFRTCILSHVDSFDDLIIAYNLEKRIDSKIFKFNTFVSKLDAGRFLQDSTTYLCNCERSESIHKHHQHNLIGILKMRRDNKRRKLFTKGLKIKKTKHFFFFFKKLS